MIAFSRHDQTNGHFECLDFELVAHVFIVLIRPDCVWDRFCRLSSVQHKQTIVLSSHTCSLFCVQCVDTNAIIVFVRMLAFLELSLFGESHIIDVSEGMHESPGLCLLCSELSPRFVLFHCLFSQTMGVHLSCSIQYSDDLFTVILFCDLSFVVIGSL